MSKVKLSIIIVHYKVKEELFECIKSIQKAKSKIPYEIIIVDNDEKEIIEHDLKKIFPEVKYIQALENIGFGAGNNLAAKVAKGKYLFFLNPDTTVFSGAIDNLVSFLEKQKEAGIVAPLLVNAKEQPYPQGSKKLGVSQGIVCLSFINKLFSNNPISKDYFLRNWDKKTLGEVDVVPGSAFLIRRSIFEKIGGFDENFFLYFEEFDLCNRVKDLGYKIFILPEAKVKHLWEVSTKRADFDIKKIFQKSRFYYFKKYYGFLTAFAIEGFLRINKISFLIIVVTILGSFLRLYKLDDLMSFIGDQGWFYLSAKDMVLKGEIPLVGIPSSHPWIHQGPLWTYMVAFSFKMFGFSPIGPAYITAFLGIFTVWLVYKVGSLLFSKDVGIISMLLYASSPLVITHARMPYHTSPIPFFTLLFILSLYKWIKGNIYFFPLAIFSLAILYNLELATSVLWFIFLPIVGYGFWQKKPWGKKIFTKKILALSFIAFLIPMLPMILYDITHGFPQTVKFIIWMGYRVVSSNFDLTSFDSMISFFALFYKRLMFAQNEVVAFVIFIFSFGWFLGYLYKGVLRNNLTLAYVLLFILIAIPLIGFFVNRTPSEAYLPIFFPSVIILTALFLNRVIRMKLLQIIGITLLFLIAIFNSYYLLSHEYFFGQKGISFKDRISIAKQIVKEANGKKFNLTGKGVGSNFASFTMNYEYLTWWLGGKPSEKKENLRFVIREERK